jgi:ElaB/YqjD/DUF883 family membrane-anchored ribosome-binding protein
MPPETELIKQQMGQTRAALTEKLETLENKVLGTISTTTDAVTQTVQDVGSTVRETTENVRATMHEALNSVRDAFDVSRQFHQHPWLLLGGSVLAGYVGGVVLDNLERGHLPSLPRLPSAPEQLLPRDSEVRERIESEPPSRRTGSTLFKALFDSFAPELDKLKAAAVGMALAVVRDKIRESVPPQMRDNVSDLMDRVTSKFGGEVHPPGAMFGQSEEHDGAETARAMGRG